MKKLIFTFAIAVLALTAGAQDKKGSDKTFKPSVGLEVGLPIGTFGDFAGLVIGGSVQGEYMAAETVGITLNAGYLNVSGKNGAGSTGMIPVLAGAKFYFAENFFGHAQAGLSFSTESGGGSAFTYAPGIGYQASENFDVTLKYQASTKNSSTSGFIGLRAAFTF